MDSTYVYRRRSTKKHKMINPRDMAYNHPQSNECLESFHERDFRLATLCLADYLICKKMVRKGFNGRQPAGGGHARLSPLEGPYEIDDGPGITLGYGRKELGMPQVAQPDLRVELTVALRLYVNRCQIGG